MTQLCRWAVVHWMRFEEPRVAADLQLSGTGQGALSFKFGPDWSASESGLRSGSRIWCCLGLFADLQHAEAAFERADCDLPDAAEAWSALLAPYAHKGECNHLNRSEPGALFAIDPCESSGPVFVITTAGFHLRSRRDFQRVIDFRREVDRMRSIIDSSDGSLAHQVFAPVDAEDDGVTMSLWRDDQAMFAFAYKPGAHRSQVDRQKSDRTVDRSSFTRFQLLRTSGSWKGGNLAA